MAWVDWTRPPMSKPAASCRLLHKKPRRDYSMSWGMGWETIIKTLATIPISIIEMPPTKSMTVKDLWMISSRANHWISLMSSSNPRMVEYKFHNPVHPIKGYSVNRSRIKITLSCTNFITPDWSKSLRWSSHRRWGTRRSWCSWRETTMTKWLFKVEVSKNGSEVVTDAKTKFTCRTAHEWSESETACGKAQHEPRG